MSNNEILQVVAEYQPSGDQPNAIKEIVSNIKVIIIYPLHILVIGPRIQVKFMNPIIWHLYGNYP